MKTKSVKKFDGMYIFLLVGVFAALVYIYKYLKKPAREIAFGVVLVGFLLWNVFPIPLEMTIVVFVVGCLILGTLSHWRCEGMKINVGGWGEWNNADSLERGNDETHETEEAKDSNFAYYDLPKVEVVVNTPYSAVMVEPRQHRATSFVLRNFLENLDERWTIVVIHGEDNQQFLQDILNSEAFQSYRHRVVLVNMGVKNLTIKQYSELFYNRQFYDYIPTEIFLIFQTDSIILKMNRNNIYSFLEYDYVGAPWNPSLLGPADVGNGGLSLRRKSKMLELLKYKHVASEQKINRQYGEYVPEDRFFNGCLTMDYVVVYKPTIEEAKNFSAEGVFAERPFGVHKCWGGELNPGELKRLITMYPEIKTLMDYNQK